MKHLVALSYTFWSIVKTLTYFTLALTTNALVYFGIFSLLISGLTVLTQKPSGYSFYTLLERK